MPELYGIHNTNVPSVLSKNIFTTYIPVSASIFLEDTDRKVLYLTVESGNLKIVEKPFSELLGVTKADLPGINWNSEYRNPSYNKSINAPGIDMAAVKNNSCVLEFEVKLTVVPTHAERKVTEMIVRQNTQFNFAERLCYKFGAHLDDSPSIEKLNELIKSQEGQQSLFILHGVWKTEDGTSKIDEDHTLDVIAISDLAYLKILLSSNLEKSSVKTRIGRVVDLIMDWITEYKKLDTISYKGPEEGSKDHLKITLYPVDYHTPLKDKFLNPRLTFDELKDIVPAESIEQLSPERRLDASIIFTLANQELESEEEDAS